MVKNFGGKKTKSVARKTQQTNTNFDVRLRMSTCSEEKYAIVRKLYGNSCSVLCDDSKERLAIIPGKFSRRNNKRNNFIAPASVVLVGIREWATVVEGKTEKCDLLEVYSTLELDQLKQRPNFPTHFIDSIHDSSGESNTDACVFSSIEDNTFIPSTESSDNTIFITDQHHIDIDDI
jgi:translation initiation factor IF-1